VAPKRSTASKEDVRMPAFMFSLPSCVRAESVSCSRKLRLVVQTENLGCLAKKLIWLSMGAPLGFPRGLGEPLDRRHHRCDGARHMGKVDAVDFVTWLMVVRVKPEAGDGMGNDSPLCQAVVIRALEEVLLGMGIGNQAGAVASK